MRSQYAVTSRSEQCFVDLREESGCSVNLSVSKPDGSFLCAGQFNKSVLMSLHSVVSLVKSNLNQMCMNKTSGTNPHN